jgi:hypothetical protein
MILTRNKKPPDWLTLPGGCCKLKSEWNQETQQARAGAWLAAAAAAAN